MLEDLPQNKPRGNFSRWTEPIKKTYYRFLKIRGNPRKLRWALLGHFCRYDAFYGIAYCDRHTARALLKWNKFSAALAVWISNPLSALSYTASPITSARRYYLSRMAISCPRNSPDALVYTLRSAPEIIGICWWERCPGPSLAAAGYFFALKTIVEYRASIQRKIEQKKNNLTKKLKRARPRRKKKKRRR